ncbi:DUF6777 domain-containing protein [Streptomyces sp. VRA16 Mangrove soil]|uniref:DUF6777 domain-containing protein n=1 Tax=Streptomyces sp. VRA16 Mangrove soil TaxID=2817434 RepID=UPI001A9E6E75|nr:DUF6777 domain-containing protein [Streptomyces sp. VRA16 Mangrove soil]MBO1332060.1 hypothetical protein [Streptomyces sp. VRA16 Mangrove soil]
MRARNRTRTFVTALGASAALLLAGCSGDGDKSAADGKGELFMQPVAAQGPDPFTDSTATSDASPPPVTRTPQPSPTGSPSATQQGVREISGATPGLYGGTHALGSCDVEQQIRFLTADRAKAGAFAGASGISSADIPSFLRGLTPVVLRADTRVTNHGYRDGSATTFQSVLQAGTAVLVDGHGVPRVRCACGNPLKSPVALQGTPNRQGQAWSGYEPTRVVVVTPAPKIIQSITIINIVNNTWIERKIGDDGDHDRVVPPPTPTPTPSPTTPTPSPSTTSPSSGDATSPSTSSSACPTVTATATDGTGSPSPSPSPWPSGCPSPTPASTQPSTPDTTTSTDVPGSDAATSDTPGTDQPSDTPSDTGDTFGSGDTGATDQDTGPDAVPDTPDQPDSGGLIPDATDSTDGTTP